MILVCRIVVNTVIKSTFSKAAQMTVLDILHSVFFVDFFSLRCHDFTGILWLVKKY